jgi:hypothetical protein
MIHLTKNKSTRRIEITTDQEDEWFLYVNWIEKKSGKLIVSNMIIRKDLEGWLRYLEGMGWVKKAES